MELEVLFEDEDVLVCYKPAGVATPSPRAATSLPSESLKNFAMMFSFADVPIFLMLLMPKGRRTIHGMANEHISRGSAESRALRQFRVPVLAPIGMRKLATVATEQCQNILAREQCR